MSSAIRQTMIPVISAMALTVLFWWPLYLGAGFIGGDLYPYFFPQKAFYADCLKAGTFPLWNDLSGFGYPVLGESQTGAAYPFHLIFYRVLNLNTAYNVEHLLHYFICSIATWLFAKRVGLTDAGAGLAALVFTYGWFPPRACLEWAILTGAWLPVALLCLESFLQTQLWRYAIGLSFAIGLQLLAGHYHLAFITDLTVVTYAAFRLWKEGGQQRHQKSGAVCRPCRKQTALGLTLAIMAGAGLASVQLLPTWELKQRSTRVITGGDYDPAYGQMPPIYVTQAIAPWMWYSPGDNGEENLVRDIAEFVAPWHWFGPLNDANDPRKRFDLDLALHRCRFAAVSTGTNRVEAHFYCGLVPLGMAFCGLANWLRNRHTAPDKNSSNSIFEQSIGYWLIGGALALIYATGILLPIGRHLPGFSFFRGPGRYGIVTTLSVALLAGQLLGRILTSLSTRSIRAVVLTLIFASTCGDLWLVSRMVKYTYMVSPPRIDYREVSEIRRMLLAEPGLPRLLAPGPNVGNLLGVSCVPWYLGMAPAEYVDPNFAMPSIPKPLANNAPTLGSPQLNEWLSRSGVTHVLNFEPLEEKSWQLELVWKGIDPLLNHVWGRDQPVYLYRFRSDGSEDNSTRYPGRAYFADGTAGVLPIDSKHQSPGVRRVSVDSKNHPPVTLILTELAFPGWQAQVNQTPVKTKQDGMFRAVDLPDGTGEVTWVYRPNSVYLGAVISLTTLLLLLAIAHLRYWHPKMVNRVLRQ